MVSPDYNCLQLRNIIYGTEFKILDYDIILHIPGLSRAVRRSYIYSYRGVPWDPSPLW